MKCFYGLALVVLASTVVVAADDKARTIKFSKEDVGKVPTGWVADKTGKGDGSVWKVVADETAPSKTGFVLAQTAESPNAMFNLCVARDTNYKDVELSVSFKPIAGKNDQGGGFVWRYQDNNNYYVARLNPAGNSSSYAVFKVVDGKRTRLQGKSADKIPVGEWHALKIKMAGDQIECYLDNEKMLAVKDDTFPKTGKVGLWSKSDAQTHFDDFKVIGAEDRQPLERVATIDLKGESGPLDHLFVDAKNSRLFVANQSNNTLDVVDLKSNKLVKQISGQKQIHGIVYLPDLDRIYVGNGDGVCNVLDGKDYSLLKSHPVKDADNVRFDPRTKRVYVAGEKDFAVIDAKSLDLLSGIKLPGSPEGFQIAAKQPRLYVNTTSPCQVLSVDTEKNEVVAKYPLEGDEGNETLALDEANQRIFVGFRGKPRICVLKLDSGKEITSVPIPEGVDDMFFDANSKRIYASCGSGSVAVIRQVDADHYESLGNIATVEGAKTSYYDPDTKRLYLAVPRQPGKDGPQIWVYQAKP
jgi:hypothetical protein